MRIRKLLWSVAALALCAPLSAGDTALRDGHPERYVVQKGDTLWGISKRFLRDPWLWPEIWQVNPDIRNPHLIYPGDAISLVYVDGQPRLIIRTSDRAGETAKLSPHVREVSLASAIPTIPLDAIRPFLTETRIVDEDTLDNAGYVLANSEGKVASSSGDKIYARGLSDEGDGNYSVVRKGRAYVDPETKKVLGLEALHVGDARLQTAGDPAALKLLKSNREVLGNDKLLPLDNVAFNSNFFPKAPDFPIDGRIIDVIDGVSEIGQHSVVVLNRGLEHGLAVGDVLAVFRAGEVVKDSFAKTPEMVTLPDELAGHLLVFRTFDEMALGLVVEARQPMHTMDAVRNP